MLKKIIPLVVAFTLLIGLIYFSDAGKIYNTLARVNVYYFLIAVGLWFVTHLIKVFRWSVLLKKNSVDVRFYRLFKIFTAGGFFSNITPAKVGEPIKSVMLKKSEGIKVSSSIPSIFFERVFDIIALIALSIVSMFFLTKTISDIQGWLLASIGVYAIAIIFALFVLVSKKRTLYFMSLFYRAFSFLPKIKDLGSRLIDFSENFHKSFSSYNSKGMGVLVFLLSVSIWVIESVILFTIFASFGFDVTLASTMFIVPVSTLISVITFLPGGIGSSEIITVLFFSSLFGLTLADVTSVAIVTRVSTFWISTILGAFFFSKIRYKYKI